MCAGCFWNSFPGSYYFFYSAHGVQIKLGPDDFDNPRVSPWKSVDTIFGNLRMNLV